MTSIFIFFQVLTALRYYASGSFLKVIGDTMGTCKASASRSVHAGSQCLCSLAREWITFPSTPEELNVNNNSYIFGDNNDTLPRLSSSRCFLKSTRTK